MRVINNKFYSWSSDVKGLPRVLKIKHQTDFIKEELSFGSWEGEFKVCNTCKQSLPKVTYFFRSSGKSGLHARCKKCDNPSSNYSWGRTKAKELNSNGLHYCKKCDTIYPLMELYFHKTKKKYSDTEFASTCKSCVNVSGDFNVRFISSYNELFGVKEGYKVCTKCFKELPSDEIHFFQRGEKEDTSSICKQCRGATFGVQMPNVVYKKIIPDGYMMCMDCQDLVKSEVALKNRYRCVPCCKKLNKKYYYSDTNIEYLKEYLQRKDVKHRRTLTAEKRRSIGKGVESTLTKDEYEETLEYFHNSCAYCGLTNEESLVVFNENLHQDHIVPLFEHGGYTKENIIPACRGCNSSKNKYHLKDFYESSISFNGDRYLKVLRFIADNIEVDGMHYLENNSLVDENSKLLISLHEDGDIEYNKEDNFE